MIKNLIFSSGGVNGYYFAGSLKYLMENNLLDNVENILGTSAGSMFGLFFILGFDCDEIIELVTKIDPSNLINFSGENILNFLEEYGLNPGDKFINIVKIILKRKIKNPNITFKELYDITNISFIIPALNINKKKMVYFSYKNYPNLEIYKAIRMSCSIPIMFKPYTFEGELYVDGGAMDPCSLSYFKDTKNTLGLCICSLEEKKIKNLKDFLFSLFYSPVEKLTNHYYDKPNIIIFPSDNSEGLDFYIENSNIKILIEKGYEITKDEIKDVLEFFKHNSP